MRMAERARALGIHVRGADVDEGALRRAARLGIEAQHGDVRSPDDMRRLCTGAELVFHTAAVVEEDGDVDRFRAINVEGTRCVLEAARAANVRHFLHLSSVMVYGFDYPREVDEDGPLRGEGNPYCETKIESEQIALGFDAPNGMRVVALRAGDVYGPGSVPWIVRPIGLLQKRLFVLPDGGRGVMNHVYVDNLIDAALAAMAGDVGGLALNVTDGENTTFAEFFARLGKMVGRERVPSLPASSLRIAFAAIERVARLLRVRPPASAAAVSFVSRPHRVSSARARRILRWAPSVTLDEGMSRTEQWLRDEHLA